MDAEEKRRAIRESRELLARLRGGPGEGPAPASQPEIEVLPPIESVSARWRREDEELDREREAEGRRRRAIERRHAEKRAPDWSGVDARIAAAIEAERAKFEARLTAECAHTLETMLEGLRAMTTLAESTGKEFVEIQTKLARLGTTLAELRAHEDRRPLDMPSPLSSRARTVN